MSSNRASNHPFYPKTSKKAKMTANMSLRETFSNKNRRNLNATPAKLPLQTSKWQLKSFSSAQFHTLPAKSNSKKLEKSNLKKMEISDFSETEKSNDDMDSRYSQRDIKPRS